MHTTLNSNLLVIDFYEIYNSLVLNSYKVIKSFNNTTNLVRYLGSGLIKTIILYVLFDVQAH